MTIGKATKKDSRLFSRTYKFMKRNTQNLTLKDFAELIEFMNDTDDTGLAHLNKPILGLGNFLTYRNQATRLNNQLPMPTIPRQRPPLTYNHNDLPTSPEQEKKENERALLGQAPGGRVIVEYVDPSIVPLIN